MCRNGFVTVTCGYKIRDFLKQFQIFPMRLDQLLVNANDLFSMVVHNLDAVALSRLSAVCRDIRKCSKQSEVWRACLLRTFPGIRGVPTGKESKVYEDALQFYFGPRWLGRGYPYLELVTLVGMNIQHTPQNTGFFGGDDTAVDAIPMKNKIRGLFSRLGGEFWHSRSRKNIIKSVNEWKSLAASDDGYFSYRYDVVEMLDRIAYIAEHNFQWYDHDGFVTLECYY